MLLPMHGGLRPQRFAVAERLQAENRLAKVVRARTGASMTRRRSVAPDDRAERRE